jgi:hypothetical protein
VFFYNLQIHYQIDVYYYVHSLVFLVEFYSLLPVTTSFGPSGPYSRDAMLDFSELYGVHGF